MVKDIEDVDGDYNSGMNTLPIVLGVSRTAKIIFALSFLPIVILLYYINAYFVANNLWILSGYALIFLVGPLLYFAIKMYSAKRKRSSPI
jgi:4-hydroxybenzoate polyprenyltransferase